MEQIQKRGYYISKAETPDEVKEELRQGKKLVFVGSDMEVPPGYMLLTVKYKGEDVRAVVPETLLIYMANPGEGDPNAALDEIADFYGDAKENEKSAIKGGETSPQKADIVTASRDAYEIYLVNKLTKNGRNFDRYEMDRLGLNNEEVEKRVKGIAAICLGKQSEKELKASNLEDLLDHKTKVNYGIKSMIDVEEAFKVWCDVGSHYEWKTKYRHTRKEGIVTRTETYSAMEKKIDNLESEIEKIRIADGKKIERHDKALIRTYANLTYIAKENPAAQLDVQPPAKEKCAEKGKEEGA